MFAGNCRAGFWTGTEEKLEAVLLSNEVIRSALADISFSILKNATEELSASPFPLSRQLDDPTDISQCSQLLVSVHYVHADAIKK